MPQEMICIVIWALYAIPLETIKKPCTRAMHIEDIGPEKRVR